MDFSFSETQTDAGALAAMVFKNECTPERLKAVDAGEGRFDPELWSRLGDSGLLGLCLPESLAGSGLGLVELCTMLIEAGRYVAPAPLASHLPAAMAIARFGDAAAQGMWLEGASTGQAILTAAIAEERDHVPSPPTTSADFDGEHWLISGTKSVVPAGTIAELFIVPAQTADGVTAFLVHPDDPGVAITPQRISDGNLVARLDLDRAKVPAARILGGVGAGEEVVAWLQQRLTLAATALELGIVKGALDLTAQYAKTREQFGRPIGTFQAVSQRLADGYIDVLGTELMLWQAAWRLEEGLPAEKEIAAAKLWAADAGHKVAHTTVHVHGGVGIDLDGEAHRYFTAGKLGEFLLGGATDQARKVGRLLADEPV
ncbi:MAG: acyl-CoA/acyl-ACP dehydrogenase [Nocardioidaceae bacterium]|nr:acyl-CoA/acyl-ACP dehydrogenase [Nocardioidaceae bacterium]